jgi:hypothetical protein
MIAESRRIPLLDLLDDSCLRGATRGGSLEIEVERASLDDERLKAAGIEALAIQRLITLSYLFEKVLVRWDLDVAQEVFGSPSLHPLPACTLCLVNAGHVSADDGQAIATPDPAAALRNLSRAKLKADLISVDRQWVANIDAGRAFLSLDLYDRKSRQLLPESDFESLVDDLLASLASSPGPRIHTQKFRLSLAVIIRELVENTHLHGRTDEAGAPLRTTSVRGLLAKRVLQSRIVPGHVRRDEVLEPIPSLELSIFDSGLGFYSSYRRQLSNSDRLVEAASVNPGSTASILTHHALGDDVPIDVEQKVLLKCLERHWESDVPDARVGHRGMGLYEVLRAVQQMAGYFEVRTGRLHAYRSFLPGELPLQIHGEDSVRPGRPKASLLDVARRMLTRPTPHDIVRGSVVRVVVPLP